MIIQHIFKFTVEKTDCFKDLLLTCLLWYHLHENDLLLRNVIVLSITDIFNYCIKCNMKSQKDTFI